MKETKERNKRKKQKKETKERNKKKRTLEMHKLNNII